MHFRVIAIVELGYFFLNHPVCSGSSVYCSKLPIPQQVIVSL